MPEKGRRAVAVSNSERALRQVRAVGKLIRPNLILADFVPLRIARRIAEPSLDVALAPSDAAI
jgi:hypothetical protein